MVMGHKAQAHSRGGEHKIAPNLYPIWLECLIETVRSHDSEFTEQLGTASRKIMTKGTRSPLPLIEKRL